MSTHISTDPDGHDHPIRGPAAALGLIREVMSSPLRAETIAIIVHPGTRATTVVSVPNTIAPDAVIEVVEVVASTAARALGAVRLVIATGRPGGGIDHLDPERWYRIDRAAADHGIVLLDWFVVCPRVHQPRLLAGELSRWPDARHGPGAVRG